MAKRQPRGRRIEVGGTSISLYARHKASCSQRTDISGTVDCQCIRWMQFTDGNRTTTGEWTWPKAEAFARKEAARHEGVTVGEIGNLPGPSYTVQKAVDEWLDERDPTTSTTPRQRT